VHAKGDLAAVGDENLVEHVCGLKHWVMKLHHPQMHVMAGRKSRPPMPTVSALAAPKRGHGDRLGHGSPGQARR